MARTIGCPCGHVVEGVDDDALFRLARKHVDEDHAEMTRTDEDLWQRIRADAKDAVPGTA